MKHIPSIIACIAALGLIALTGALIVRPVADLSLWRVGTMALAWVAVLATGLASRDRVVPAPVDDEP